MKKSNRLSEYLEKKRIAVEAALKQLVPAKKNSLTRAMSYSLMAGGKRLRPILALLAAESCSKKSVHLIKPACALEFIHTYSLIHDDLPAMDNDDLRRGKPTSHKKFGEASAILAGDALLSDAFGLITEHSKRFNPANVLRAITLLSRAAGSNGMVLGQLEDTAEAGNWKNASKAKMIATLTSIHKNKTAALLRASLEFGAVMTGASEKQIRALGGYGENIGLAFQIADDILDIVGNKKLLGKRGSDTKNNKLTFPAIYGIDKSRKLARALIRRAKKKIEIFGAKAGILNELADYIIHREK